MHSTKAEETLEGVICSLFANLRSWLRRFWPESPSPQMRIPRVPVRRGRSPTPQAVPNRKAAVYLEAHLAVAAAGGDEHATAARRVADGALSAGSTLPRPGVGPSPRSPQRLQSGREVAAAWLLCVFIAVLALGATSGLHNSEPPADTLTNRTAVRWHMRTVCTPPLRCAEGGTAILEPW